VDMGVEPFLVASSLMGVLAQRLVRVLCKDCRTPYLPTPEELKEIGLTPDEVREASGGMLYKPAGCEQCNQTGYHGRSGIYEMMLMDDEVRALTLKNVDSGTIKRTAVNKGMLTLMDDGARKVVRGITSVAEVLSVTQEDVA